MSLKQQQEQQNKPKRKWAPASLFSLPAPCSVRKATSHLLSPLKARSSYTDDGVGGRWAFSLSVPAFLPTTN